MANRDKITGAWSIDSNTGGVYISSQGSKVDGFYQYPSLGRKKSRFFFAEDANNNGRHDSADPVVGSFLAKTSFILNKLPIIASGRFVADEDSGRFSLFYGSTKFATGSIFDPSDFF